MDATPAAVSYLNLRQFCRLTGLSASTVRRLVRAGEISFLQPAGKRGKLLFRADALERGVNGRHPEIAPGPNPRSGRRPRWTIA